MPHKIVILGAGVAGITVAHELGHIPDNQYEIHLYDRNDSIGGMARSGYKQRNGTLLPTEYCWRIYGPNYNNLREILKQIPLQHNPRKTVHDNLVDISNYLIADQGTIFKMNNRPSTLWRMRKAFKNVPMKEKTQVLRKVLYGLMISTDRLNKLDNTTWNDCINPQNLLCHDMRKYIVDIMAPYLGADHLKVNVPSVIKTIESFKILNKAVSVMNSPTNEAWFDHWKHYLEGKGVVFHLNSTVKYIQETNNRINYVQLADDSKVDGDTFICALSVESAATLLAARMPQIKPLAETSYQLMVGIQLYFDKKIKFSHKGTALYIPDSPWQLVIEPQGAIWNKSYGDVADLWSIGLCDPVRPGLLIEKPFVQCSHEEIKNEVWHQLSTSELGKHLNLDQVNVLDYNVWDTYKYNGREIQTYEPKFSTNKNTYFLRPENTTPYENMLFATAYTKTDTDMFEMESAAESGRRAAKLLEKSVNVKAVKRPLLFKLYRMIDTCFPNHNFFQSAPFSLFILALPFAICAMPFLYFDKTFNN